MLVKIHNNFLCTKVEGGYWNNLSILIRIQQGSIDIGFKDIDKHVFHLSTCSSQNDQPKLYIFIIHSNYDCK